jgi:hypothetical protein
MFNSDCNTFLLAIGPSSSNHDGVFRRFLSDLRSINGFGQPLRSYSRALDSPMRSYVYPYVLLQDTPEKTSCNGLASFKARNAAYFGHIMDLDGREGLLPSCASCLQRRLHSTFETTSQGEGRPTCPVCFDWNPPSLTQLSWGMLRRYVTEVADRAYREGLRDKNSVVNQLRRCGVSPEVSSQLADCIVIRVIQGDRERPLPLPSMWYGDPFFDVCESIEVVMHLLFLGIVKTTAKNVFQPFLAGRNQWTSYRQKSNEISAEIRDLGLQWLRVLPMKDGGTHGGWVSENYLGYGRIMKYLCTLVEISAATDEEYSDPSIPLEQYTRQQLKDWLSARGLVVHRPIDRTRLMKEDYYNTIVATGWNGPGTNPAPLENPAKGVDIRLFLGVVCSCYSMISEVMSVTGKATKEQLWAVDRAVKIYLSYDDKFHEGGARLDNPERKIPAIQTRNKINLLRLVPMLWRYGSLHLLTELGPKGERAIQRVKPIIVKNQGVARVNWASRAATGWARRHSVKTLITMAVDALRTSLKGSSGLHAEELSLLQKGRNILSQLYSSMFPEQNEAGEPCQGTKLDGRKAKYHHVYKNRSQIRRLLNTGKKCVSGVQIRVADSDEPVFAIAYRHKSGLKFAKIEATSLYGPLRAGCAFWNWQMIEGPECHDGMVPAEDVALDDAIVLLPLLGADAQRRDVCTSAFYAVSYSWKEMDGEGNMVVCRLNEETNP